MQNFTLLHYTSELKPYFLTLNREWLEEYFSVTAEDIRQLANPELILHSGGAVLFVESQGAIIATCGLSRVNDETIELIKMGVKAEHRRKGVGAFLLKEAEKEAAKMGGIYLQLETAETLKPAISLYLKHGFKRVGEEYIHPVFGRKVFEMRKLINRTP